MVKLTFSLDEETVRTLRRLAERTRKPQSQLVREALAHYATRDERMTADEREKKLRILHAIASRPSGAADTDRELRELRATRRRAGRLHTAE